MFGFKDKKNKENTSNGKEAITAGDLKISRRQIITDIISRQGPKIIPPQKITASEPKNEFQSEFQAVQEKAYILPEASGTERDEKNKGDKTKNSGKIFAASILLSVLVLGTAVFSLSTFFSSFTVTIFPKVESVDLSEIPVLVDTKASYPVYAKRTIPGEIFATTKVLSEEFNATGKENVEDRARGIIKIYNTFSSSPQKLVATTRFLDDSGNVFRLTKNVTVPGALIEDGAIKPSSILAEAEANHAGEEFNIGPSHFKIPGFKGTPKYDTFYGESESNFSGGFKGIAAVVSADDIKKASESLTAKLFNSLKDELTKKIPSEFRFLEPLREVVIENLVLPKKNERAEKFKIEARGSARAIVFRDKDLEELVKIIVFADKPDKEMVGGSFSSVFKKHEARFDKGIAELNVAGTIKVRSKIEADKVLALILGKKFGTIEEFLKKNEAISSFQFKSFPFWNLKAPKDPKKVNITVK